MGSLIRWVFRERRKGTLYAADQGCLHEVPPYGVLGNRTPVRSWNFFFILLTRTFYQAKE
jgi:hypothetical protein